MCNSTTLLHTLPCAQQSLFRLSGGTKLIGAGWNKKRDQDRVDRGVLFMERNVLLAIVPISELISGDSIK